MSVKKKKQNQKKKKTKKIRKRYPILRYSIHTLASTVMRCAAIFIASIDKFLKIILYFSHQ